MCAVTCGPLGSPTGSLPCPGLPGAAGLLSCGLGSSRQMARMVPRVEAGVQAKSKGPEAPLRPTLRTGIPVSSKPVTASPGSGEREIHSMRGEGRYKGTLRGSLVSKNQGHSCNQCTTCPLGWAPGSDPSLLNLLCAPGPAWTQHGSSYPSILCPPGGMLLAPTYLVTRSALSPLHSHSVQGAAVARASLGTSVPSAGGSSLVFLWEMIPPPLPRPGAVPVG